MSRNLWYRNINRLCIDYASRPRLSSRLTLGGLAFPRNPWTSGGGVSHPSLATHTNILTRARSTTVSTAASLQTRRSATTPAMQKSATSASDLSPVTFSARDHSTSELLRTLLMVAASKPTSWLSEPSHIVSHLVVIWDLSWRSGLFPFPLRTLAPAVCLPDSTYWYSEFAKGW